MVQFEPPLDSAVIVSVPPTLLSGSSLCLYATLSRDEYAGLCRDGTTIQVWSDIGTGAWVETSFAEKDPTGGVQDETAIDFSLREDSRIVAESGDVVTLVVTFPLPPLVGRTVHATYRMLHQSGAVSWLGSMGTNCSITVEAKHDVGLRPENWYQDADGKFSRFTVPAKHGPVVCTQLAQDADWRGWAIGTEGPSTFTAVSSAVTEKVALALLPTARPGAYASYAPVLYYTTGNATLSLTDSGEVLFHPVDENSALYASISTGTWMNAISSKTVTLDLHSPHFLGVSVKRNADVHCIHVLPVSSFKAAVTLKSSDLRSLASSWEVLTLVDSTSHAAKFITASSLNDVCVGIGPAGGEILVVPGHTLRNKGSESNVACWPRGAGRVTPVPADTNHATHAETTFPSSSEDTASGSAVTEELSESKTLTDVSPQTHTPSILGAQIVWLILHPLQFLWSLIFVPMVTSLPPQVLGKVMGERQPVPMLSGVPGNEIAPGLQLTPMITFEVTGKFAIVVNGDILKVALDVDGRSLEATSKDVGGVWLLESDSSDTQLLIITLRE